MFLFIAFSPRHSCLFNATIVGTGKGGGSCLWAKWGRVVVFPLLCLLAFGDTLLSSPIFTGTPNSTLIKQSTKQGDIRAASELIRNFHSFPLSGTPVVQSFPQSEGSENLQNQDFPEELQGRFSRTSPSGWTPSEPPLPRTRYVRRLGACAMTTKFLDNKIFRNILVSVKFVSAILGPAMAAPILWTPGKMGSFCRKTCVHKIPRFGGGGVFWGLGGGGVPILFLWAHGFF